MVSTTYTVHLERRAERELRRLPQNVARRIDIMLRQLATNPCPSGVVKLTGRTGSGWRVRVGEYRILYQIDDDARRSLSNQTSSGRLSSMMIRVCS